MQVVKLLQQLKKADNSLVLLRFELAEKEVALERAREDHSKLQHAVDSFAEVAKRLEVMLSQHQKKHVSELEEELKRLNASNHRQYHTFIYFMCSNSLNIGLEKELEELKSQKTSPASPPTAEGGVVELTDEERTEGQSLNEPNAGAPYGMPFGYWPPFMMPPWGVPGNHMAGTMPMMQMPQHPAQFMAMNASVQPAKPSKGAVVPPDGKKK